MIECCQSEERSWRIVLSFFFFFANDLKENMESIIIILAVSLLCCELFHFCLSKNDTK